MYLHHDTRPIELHMEKSQRGAC